MTQDIRTKVLALSNLKNTLDAFAAKDSLGIDDFSAFFSTLSSFMGDIQTVLFELLNIKPVCKVATVENIDLAETLVAGATLDSITLVANDRVLVKNQTTAQENGVYVVASTGAPTRAADLDQNSDFAEDVFVFVTHGATQANTLWKTSATPEFVIGDTEIVFVEV